MTSRTHPARRGDGLSPTDPRLLGDPLEFIATDHLRIRAMCGAINRLSATGHASSDEASSVLSFLTKELPLLVADEDEDLLPLVMRRSTADDEIPRLKARLDQEHADIAATLPQVIETFQNLAVNGGAISDLAKQKLNDFAGHIRRHLILENAVLLPFARLRLTDSDLESLTRCMLARRGLDRLMETPNAQ